MGFFYLGLALVLFLFSFVSEHKLAASQNVTLRIATMLSPAGIIYNYFFVKDPEFLAYYQQAAYRDGFGEIPLLLFCYLVIFSLCLYGLIQLRKSLMEST